MSSMEINKINGIDETNENLLEQLSTVLPYNFKLTSLKFDLQYHADIKVIDENGLIEYWLMRFRRHPYRDFTIRTSAKRYASEFEKIYHGKSISKRYLHVILDQNQSIKEAYIVNVKRLSQMKLFLENILQVQRKPNFVYITPEQLIENNLVDIHVKTQGDNNGRLEVISRYK